MSPVAKRFLRSLSHISRPLEHRHRVERLESQCCQHSRVGRSREVSIAELTSSSVSDVAVNWLVVMHFCIPHARFRRFKGERGEGGKKLHQYCPIFRGHSIRVPHRQRDCCVVMISTSPRRKRHTAASGKGSAQRRVRTPVVTDDALYGVIKRCDQLSMCGVITDSPSTARRRQQQWSMPHGSHRMFC